MFDRLTGSNIVLATGTPGSGWSSWAAQPLVSSNGTAVFQSWDSRLVVGDLNCVSDVFGESVNTVSIMDSDGDGIPDWWMIKYFGHPAGQVDDLTRAQDDADGDGMNNLQEYLAGTDPTNPLSVFSLHISVVSVSGNSVLLTWPAMPGKGYQIQYKNNLTDPAWLATSGNASVLGQQGYLTVPFAQSGGFYRIVCVN